MTSLFYTNYYTNALGKRVYHRFGGAVLHTPRVKSVDPDTGEEQAIGGFF